MSETFCAFSIIETFKRNPDSGKSTEEEKLFLKILHIFCIFQKNYLIHISLSFVTQ